MKTQLFIAVASVACAGLFPTVCAEEAPAPAPAAVAEAPYCGFTPERAAAYLQAERDMVNLITFDDKESEAENMPEFRKLWEAFRKEYPAPLAAALLKGHDAPEWLVNALKEEHELLLQLIQTTQPVKKATRDEFPEMTSASRAIYEPLLLSHVALQDHEGKVLDAYIHDHSLEKAKTVMHDALTYTDQDSYFYRSGFLYQLFANHPDKLTELLESISGNNEAMGNAVVGEALWLLNTDESLASMFAWPALTNPRPDMERPDFHHLENLVNNIDEAQVLDCAWGVYDASQDEEVLRSFIRCGVRESAPEKGYVFWAAVGATRPAIPEQEGDIIALTARWSVRSRAKQNSEFAEKVQAILSTFTPEEQARFNAPLPVRNTKEYKQN